MLSKAKISWVRSLSQQKQRKEQGLFIAEGPKLVAEMLKGHFKVLELFALPEWLKQYEHLLHAEMNVNEISHRDLEKISNLITPNDVLAILKIPENEIPNTDTLQGMVLALDAIRDPGNLGTMIRTADWFGIKHILLSDDSVELWNPKVVQATMGAMNRVQVHVVDILSYLSELKNKVHILGAMMDGENIYVCNLPDSFVMVIGNESHGIRPEIVDMLDGVITVPPSLHTASESLNASIASAVICSEWARRQRDPQSF